MSAILIVILAFASTASLTPMVGHFARRVGLVARPRDDRWHSSPTPYLGGIAILGGFGVAALAGYLLDPTGISAFAASRDGFLHISPALGLLLGGGAAFILGLVDDLVHVMPAPKLLGQTVAATILVGSGIELRFTGNPWIDGAGSIFWFVAITNALNLLDNMDGLAAGTVAIASGYLSLLFFLDGDAGLMIFSLALTGSMLGFLAHNYPPAKIFMGDCGSLFLGLFISGLALSPAPGLSRSLLAVLILPAAVLAIPILDTTVVTIGRIMEGSPIARGGRDHTSHRLVGLGLSEVRAVWTLWSLAILGGGVAVLVRAVPARSALLLGGGLLLILGSVGIYLLLSRAHMRLQKEE